MASVLVVEDDLALRKLMRSVLEKSGYQVTEAGDGEEGVEQCHRSRPDVVITDILMPRKDGLELIRELKREYPDVKIIAITGGVGRLDFLAVAEVLGVRRTLHKTFFMKDLIQAVQEVLQSEADRIVSK
jgi:CheY-like chemotaxis protein